jgi:A/G-specific adenine glycosylase
MDQQAIDSFRRTLAGFYADFGRHDMLWRQPEPDGSHDPYKILVSELMLQQTQVARVTPKYAAFLTKFPTVQSLAVASLGDVLQMWSGLGYNRRAKFLWQAAAIVVNDFNGQFPGTSAELVRLPGVGPNTAGAIMAYAFNEPVEFVETNIRTVIIHHFFNDEIGVTDKAIRAILEQILNAVVDDSAVLEPREFYWAMMDYGAHLKKTVGNLNRASKSYSRQSTFAGSRRQVRGQVIRLLTERSYELNELVNLLNDDRAESVASDLIKEGLVRQVGGKLSLS